ncbi:hypothetical protein A0256_23320 [Mucilaginibacter sp. PAMC 26640]|nr:hypothetical protein A0256_23320 [Mucilaginibacter sp. PAMC 26640]
MNSTIENYFDKMEVGQYITIAKAKDPEALIEVGKKYIDQGGNIEFSNDWKEIKKNRSISTHSMNKQTIVGRSLAQIQPDLYKQIEDSVTPMLVDTAHIKSLLHAVRTSHPAFDETDVRILTVAVIYDSYCPASFLPKAAMKLPIGVRDEAARVLGYSNPENINNWRSIASAYIKGRDFRARVDAIKAQFKQFSSRPSDWQLAL